MEWILVSLASALAGFVDAIVGGGGLILVPAMFAAFPTTTPATLFGTNKSAAVWGTAISAWQYSKRVHITWATLVPAIGTTLVGAFLGAWAVTLISPDFLRKLLPFILLGVLGYTLAKKELGRDHEPRLAGRTEMLTASTIGLLIGFYDGFFGPGTGSFLIFLFIRLLQMDFLHASVMAKIVNVSTNLAAIGFFVSHGEVFWKVAAVMALCNLAGSQVGAAIALRYGAAFIRKAFLVVVTVLILRFSADIFLA